MIFTSFSASEKSFTDGLLCRGMQINELFRKKVKKYNLYTTLLNKFLFSKHIITFLFFFCMLQNSTFIDLKADKRPFFV